MAGRTKKSDDNEKIVKESKKQVAKGLRQDELDRALATIEKQRVDIEKLKAALATAFQSEEDWISRFDKQVIETEAIVRFVKSTIERLKYAFKMGIDSTGSLTYADIDYNLDLLPRMLDHKFKEKESSED